MYLIFTWLLWIRQNIFCEMFSCAYKYKNIHRIISEWDQMSFSHAHTHLAHKPLFLLHANVQQLGLIQNFIQSQMISITSLVPCLKKRKTKRWDVKREFKCVTATSTSVDYSLTAFNYCHVTLGNCQDWQKKKVTKCLR